MRRGFGKLTVEQRREISRRGGEAKAAAIRAAKAPPAPYSGDIFSLLELLNMTPANGWGAWWTFWRAVYGKLEPDDMPAYTLHTGRTEPPTGPASTVVILCGRRSGKSRNLAVAAFHRAISTDFTKTAAPGELVQLPLVAADKKQSAQILGYLKGMSEHPELKRYVTESLKHNTTFTTGCVATVFTASARLTRGYSLGGLYNDELSFWRSKDDAADADREVLTALRPGMSNVPGSVAFYSSTPWAPRGEMHRLYMKYFGQNEPGALCWNADSLSMNRALDPQFVKDEHEKDPVGALSEFGDASIGRVVWRTDVSALFDPAAVDAVIANGRRELPPRDGVIYAASCDPSGGVNDDMVLSIAHLEQDRVIQDLVRYRSPRFDPAVVAGEFAQELRRYRIDRLIGDRYSAGWCEGEFARLGITYVPSGQTASEAFRSLLAIVNSGGCQLLDIPKLRNQLLLLERSLTREQEKIGHPRGAHDDIACATALVVSSLQAKHEVPLALPTSGLTRVSPWRGEGDGRIQFPSGGTPRHLQSIFHMPRKKWPD